MLKSDNADDGPETGESIADLLSIPGVRLYLQFNGVGASQPQ
jgi:hypothetical protein